MKTNTLNNCEYLAGIVGGLGPQAGVHFQQMLLDSTQVENDQGHIPVIYLNNPKIPDRNESILRSGEDFYPDLLSSVKIIEETGVNELFIICMTAHYALEDLRKQINTPIFDFINETILYIKSKNLREKICLLATESTYQIGLFEKAAENHHLKLSLPNDKQRSFLMSIIYNVKKNQIDIARRDFLSLITELQNEKNGAFILGCTELSFLLNDTHDFFVGIDPLMVGIEHIISQVQDQV